MLEMILILLLLIVILRFLKREAEHNATEKSLLSVINHTFRMPLTNIKWTSDFLLGDVSRAEQIKFAQGISNSVDRLLEIIDILAGIKAVSNISSYNLKSVSLREIVESSIKKHGEKINEKKINLSVPVFLGIPLLVLDNKRISFAIDVLLENSIWYTKAGGNIKITCEEKGDKIFLTIEDDGLGLSWRDKRNLFKHFYRGEEAKKMNTDGMGLGLYLSKEIIKRHKGKIFAHSSGRDRGSIFSIVLPE